MKKQVTYYLDTVLNSYAIIFFSQNKVLAALLFTVSFFNSCAGLTGVAAIAIAVFIVNALGFCRETARTGLYSFNALLLGIGFGTFFEFNTAYWAWLGAALIICTFLSVTLTAFLGKYGLPMLSIPFILTFWIVLAASQGYVNMGLEQKQSYILFELFAGGFDHVTGLSAYLDQALTPAVQLFFRSVSAILFQNNVLAGIIMSIGILIHSRIGFSLLVIGFITACTFNQMLGVYPEGISNYHLGANFMMGTAAIGGFFLIPSWRAYVWGIITVPVTFLAVAALSRILETIHLPVFSVPFCLVTTGLLYFFLLRVNPGKLQLTTYQHYSPEKNLYQLFNSKARWKGLQYLPVELPFMGTWSVSQAYDGNITHKGDWGKALDFVITDADGRTFSGAGNLPEHYYCYSKPVLACADGVVEEVIDYIDDNEIGQVNLNQNWGNTIVIRHTAGLYSKLSHLRKHSAKVKAGDFVKHGEVLALCGNSGRSPEPHLHFQLQATPYIGSKTIAYPLAAYVSEGQLHNFSVPEEGALIARPDVIFDVKNAFTFKAGYITRVSNGKTTETWEVFADACNYLYFLSHETGAVAYFTYDAASFRFTVFYGNRKSLLYLFYLAAYRVNYSAHAATDMFPLTLRRNAIMWLQDLVAPFFNFVKLTYNSKVNADGAALRIESSGKTETLANSRTFLQACIEFSDQGIATIDMRFKNQQIMLIWENAED